MSYFEDGSYSCTPGIELIAKVLAGRCKMKYTRAAVGSGQILETENPKTMTGPAGYVMDAQIAAVSNPVNGECQVTVQINSSDVDEGFYATGIMLYAEDPDDGDVPYTYLVLENGPEWIRPSGSAVGKLATFDLIAVVGEVDKVTATIDPESIVTYAAVEQMISEAISKRDITIPSDGWDVSSDEDDDVGEGTYYVDVPQDGVTENMVPVISIPPSGMDAAQTCGLSSVTRTMDGAIRFYAESAPEEEIAACLVLLGASGVPEETGTPDGGTGYAGRRAGCTCDRTGSPWRRIRRAG